MMLLKFFNITIFHSYLILYGENLGFLNIFRKSWIFMSIIEMRSIRGPMNVLISFFFVKILWLVLIKFVCVILKQFNTNNNLVDEQELS